MDKLLNHEEHYDQITGEPLEKINVDLCSYNLRDQQSGLLHKKRTGLVTASQSFKQAAAEMGQCRKDHPHEPLEGGSKCKQAQAWTEEFCNSIIE